MEQVIEIIQAEGDSVKSMYLKEDGPHSTNGAQSLQLNGLILSRDAGQGAGGTASRTSYLPRLPQTARKPSCRFPFPMPSI